MTDTATTASHRTSLWSRIITPLSPYAFKHPTITFDDKQWQLVFVSLMINLAGMAVPIFTLQMYDRILVNENISTLIMLAIGVMAFILSEGILRLLRAYIMNWSGSVYEHTVACNSIRHMLASDLLSLNQVNSGAQLHRLSSVNGLRDFYNGQALVTLIDLPFVFIFLGLIGYLAGMLVMVPLLLLGLFVLIAWYLGIRMKRALQARERADQQRMDFMISMLSAIHTIKGLALEHVFQRRYKTQQAQASRANYQVARKSNRASSYGAIVTQAMIIGIIAMGAPMVMQGHVTMGTLVACTLLSGRIMSPVQRALGLWTRFQSFRLARTAVNATFELPLIARDDVPDTATAAGSINLSHVTFAYNQHQDNVLRDISCEISTGETVIIRGAHQSGKSTLPALMAGLYVPDEGHIRLQGRDVSRMPARVLINHIGYMGMNGTIFRGTIRDNLTAFGVIDEQEVHHALALLELEKDIASLPAGYDTMLEGAGADPIPPGMQQRITIARVLASKPAIILYDNAERALDSASRQLTYHTLAQLKGCTTLVISSDHKDLVALGDREITLRDGVLHHAA